MIQLLTCTGERQEAWAMCIKCMMEQTYSGPVKWIIVDDGAQASIIPDREGWEIVVIRPEPFWSPGQNTQQRNMLAGLAIVDIAEPLIIIEDDDHYHNRWIEVCALHIQDCVLFGQGLMRKYNVKQRVYRDQVYPDHCSLACTATRAEGTEKLIEIAMVGHTFMDLVLWRSFKHAGKRGTMTTQHYVTGMKQMPGRAGIDSCQRDDVSGKHDKDGYILTEWVGPQAAEIYRGYYDDKKTGNSGLCQGIQETDLPYGGAKKKPSRRDRKRAAGRHTA